MAYGADRFILVAMRAANRLRNDAIDELQIEQILRGQLEGGSSILRVGGGAPEDGGAALRRNYGIDGVLEHVNAVSGCDRDGAAGAAFADDDGDERHFDAKAGLDGFSDGLGLAAFLRLEAGIS